MVEHSPKIPASEETATGTNIQAYSHDALSRFVPFHKQRHDALSRFVPCHKQRHNALSRFVPCQKQRHNALSRFVHCHRDMMILSRAVRSPRLVDKRHFTRAVHRQSHRYDDPAMHCAFSGHTDAIHALFTFIHTRCCSIHVQFTAILP